MNKIIRIDDETTITDKEYVGLVGLAFVGSMTISTALFYGTWKLCQKGFERLWDKYDERMREKYEKQKEKES